MALSNINVGIFVSQHIMRSKDKLHWNQSSKEVPSIMVPEIPSQGWEKREQLSEAHHEDTDTKSAI